MKLKNDLIQFAVWTRNGIAFAAAWFLILILIYNSIVGIPSISTEDLVKMMFWIAGGVLLFNLFFTRLIIRKARFTARLTFFLIIFGLYETLYFYWVGLFSEIWTVLQWLVFVGIIFVSYLICVAIYHVYSKRKGDMYTMALRKYQQERSKENGEE